MRESGADRDVAIAFLHGYLLGKSGSSKFNLDVLHKQSNDFSFSLRELVRPGLSISEIRGRKRRKGWMKFED